MLISSLTWIPKGAANPFPKRAENYDEEEEDNEIYDEEEINDAKKALENEQDSAEEQEEDDANEVVEEDEKPKKKKTDSFMERYNFDDYDDDEDENDDEEERGLKFINSAMKGLMFHKDGAKDPYLKDDENDLEELEDIIIRPTDALLVTAIANESDYSYINVMVYEEENNNLYVHHDIALGTFPLCLAWMDQKPSNSQEKGNLVAVGSFDPVIEIWDLDIIDNLIPEVILGHDDKEKGLKKKKISTNLSAHKDSVLSLSWNSQQRNVLASGSADKTIKVWDITTQQCLNTFQQHKDKVQSLQWNPQEKTVLLSGGFDKFVNILDIRMDASTSFKWNIKSDIECVCWNPHNPREFFVTSEDGYIRCFEATQGSNSKPIWSVKAHNQSVSSFSVSPGQPGYFASGSSDHTIKLWSVKDQTPTLIVDKKFPEEVFSLSFFSSSPYLLAVGSESNQPNIVNTRKFQAVQTCFSLERQEGEEKEPVLVSHKGNKGGESDNEEDDEEEEEDDEEMIANDEDEEEEEEDKKGNME